MPTIEFSVEELNVLQQFLHVATQARGLEVAEAAAVLNRRINGSLEEHQKAVQAAQVAAPQAHILPPTHPQHPLNAAPAAPAAPVVATPLENPAVAPANPA